VGTLPVITVITPAITNGNTARIGTALYVSRRAKRIIASRIPLEIKQSPSVARRRVVADSRSPRAAPRSSGSGTSASAWEWTSITCSTTTQSGASTTRTPLTIHRLPRSRSTAGALRLPCSARVLRGCRCSSISERRRRQRRTAWGHQQTTRARRPKPGRVARPENPRTIAPRL